MRDKEFSDIVSERFSGFGGEPSSDVWAGIEANLDQNKKRRRAIIWWSLAALFALSAITLNLVSNNDSETTTAIKSADKSTTPKTENNIKNNSNNQKSTDLNSRPSAANSSVTDKNSEISIGNNSHKNPTKKVTLIEPVQKGLPSIEPVKLINISEEFLIPDPENLADSRVDMDPMETLPYVDLTTIPMRTVCGRPLPQKTEPEIGATAITAMVVTHSRWSLGVKATGFINASKPSSVTNWSGTSSALADPSFVYYDFNSHQRYFETEVFANYFLNKRITLGTGVMFSLGFDAQRIDTTIYATKRKTFGIPLEAQFTIVRDNRFKLSGNLAIINEYARVRTDIGVANAAENTISTSDPSVYGIESVTYTIVENYKGHNFAFGLQGSIQAEYHLRPKITALASIGYRNYLIERYSLSRNYVTNPNYFNASIGLKWHFYK